MVDQAGQLIGDQSSQRGLRGQLEALAERALEIDEDVDPDRARPDDDPVAFWCRSGGNAVGDLRGRHGTSGTVGLHHITPSVCLPGLARERGLAVEPLPVRPNLRPNPRHAARGEEISGASSSSDRYWPV